MTGPTKRYCLVRYHSETVRSLNLNQKLYMKLDNSLMNTSVVTLMFDKSIGLGNLTPEHSNAYQLSLQSYIIECKNNLLVNACPCDQWRDMS